MTTSHSQAGCHFSQAICEAPLLLSRATSSMNNTNGSEWDKTRPTLTFMCVSDKILRWKDGNETRWSFLLAQPFWRKVKKEMWLLALADSRSWCFSPFFCKFCSHRFCPSNYIPYKTIVQSPGRIFKSLLENIFYVLNTVDCWNQVEHGIIFEVFCTLCLRFIFRISCHLVVVRRQRCARVRASALLPSLLTDALRRRLKTAGVRKSWASTLWHHHNTTPAATHTRSLNGLRWIGTFINNVAAGPVATVFVPNLTWMNFT